MLQPASAQRDYRRGHFKPQLKPYLTDEERSKERIICVSTTNMRLWNRLLEMSEKVLKNINASCRFFTGRLSQHPIGSPICLTYSTKCTADRMLGLNAH
jgi:hypothetical protein